MYSSIRTATNSQTSKLTGSDKVLLKEDNGEQTFFKLRNYCCGEILRVEKA
jgi:hypothetical protein